MEDEMAKACGLHGKEEENIVFQWETQKVKGLHIDGSIILKWILEK
jgi:hypothetical protein